MFESFDAEHPLGSASIGQCHLARLKGSGKLVAVKIMYPEAEACFQSDMRTLRSFAQIAQPAYVSMLGTCVCACVFGLGWLAWVGWGLWPYHVGF